MVRLFYLDLLRFPWRMAPFRREAGRPRKDEEPAPSKVVEVKIPLDLLERLERIAREKRISRHLAIRLAIAAWVEAEEKGEGVPPVSQKKLDPTGE